MGKHVKDQWEGICIGYIEGGAERYLFAERDWECVRSKRGRGGYSLRPKVRDIEPDPKGDGNDQTVTDDLHQKGGDDDDADDDKKDEHDDHNKGHDQDVDEDDVHDKEQAPSPPQKSSAQVLAADPPNDHASNTNNQSNAASLSLNVGHGIDGGAALESVSAALIENSNSGNVPLESRGMDRRAHRSMIKS